MANFQRYLMVYFYIALLAMIEFYIRLLYVDGESNLILEVLFWFLIHSKYQDLLMTIAVCLGLVISSDTELKNKITIGGLVGFCGLLLYEIITYLFLIFIIVVSTSGQPLIDASEEAAETWKADSEEEDISLIDFFEEPIHHGIFSAGMVAIFYMVNPFNHQSSIKKYRARKSKKVSRDLKKKRKKSPGDENYSWDIKDLE